NQGFNLQASVEHQGWENYFKILDGPIYDKLVLEFWKNARIKSKASKTPEIKSTVIGHPVNTTLSQIAMAIGCPKEGRSCFIPYGRVISLLLSQQGIVKKARCNRLSEYLDISLGPKFQVNEQTNNSAEASSSQPTSSLLLQPLGPPLSP
ncbi:hypothetical protein A2U01_0007320, partial [Trifolium medium]|nr:hypothetical protein [Trifolium medium]